MMDGGAGRPSSTRRHKIFDANMPHAHRHFVDAFDLDRGLTMLISPTPPTACSGWTVVSRNDRDVIVHAMPARPKFLR